LLTLVPAIGRLISLFVVAIDHEAPNDSSEPLPLQSASAEVLDRNSRATAAPKNVTGMAAVSNSDLPRLRPAVSAYGTIRPWRRDDGMAA
jgi:hypothetical protein